MRIGHDRIIQESDTYCVFAVQIGVTRVGSGGRCQPRCKRGGMTTVAGLVASLVEPQELVHGLARRAVDVARMARAVVAMAAWVVVQPMKAAAEWLTVRMLRSERIQLWALGLGFTGFLLSCEPIWSLVKLLVR